MTEMPPCSRFPAELLVRDIPVRYLHFLSTSATEAIRLRNFIIYCFSVHGKISLTCSLSLCVIVDCVICCDCVCICYSKVVKLVIS